MRFPPYQGPKHTIQIVRISIPLEEVKKYPELGEKLVGFGLYNMFKAILDQTGRFNMGVDHILMYER
jgi:hypothetical protein